MAGVSNIQDRARNHGIMAGMVLVKLQGQDVTQLPFAQVKTLFDEAIAAMPEPSPKSATNKRSSLAACVPIPKIPGAEESEQSASAPAERMKMTFPQGYQPANPASKPAERMTVSFPQGT